MLWLQPYHWSQLRPMSLHTFNRDPSRRMGFQGDRIDRQGGKLVNLGKWTQMHQTLPLMQTREIWFGGGGAYRFYEKIKSYQEN